MSSKAVSGVKIIRRARSVSKANIKTFNIKKSNFERKPTNKFGEVTLTGKDIKKILGGRISGDKILKKTELHYPPYLYGLINSANTMSGSTRPNKIRKLHDLFKKRKFRSLGEWKKWYLSKHPNAINRAVSNILAVFEKNFDISASKRRKYRKYIRQFVENLVFEQTYRGLKIQEVIFIKMSKITGEKYRWGTNREDSSGVDGFIGDIPLSIKPQTSSQKKPPGVKRAYYEIKKDKNDKSTLTFTFSL